MFVKIQSSILLFITTLLSFSNANACSTAAWANGAAVGDATTGTPAVDVPRINGSCGLKVTGAGGYVQDDTPDNEDLFVGRFYFHPVLTDAGETLIESGSPEIFIAYSDETPTKLFSVEYDHSNQTIVFDAQAAGGTSVSTAITGEYWHLIEFVWESGETGSLWVDADATSDAASVTFSSGTGVVETVRLGAPNGFDGLTGNVFFDDYVSTRLSHVGPVLAGDSDLDGDFDQVDIDAITSEFLSGTYPDGSTDCNLDTKINSGDVNCVVEKL